MVDLSRLGPFRALPIRHQGGLAYAFRDAHCQGLFENINSLTAGQSDSCGLCQSSRWHSVAAASKTGEGPLAVGPSLRRNTVCPAHTRGDQSSGRCGIQGDSRSPGLEAIGGNFPEDQCHLGAPEGRSVCHTPFHSTSLILQLEARRSSRSNRCFSAGLAWTARNAAVSSKQLMCILCSSGDQGPPVWTPSHTAFHPVREASD